MATDQRRRSNHLCFAPRAVGGPPDRPVVEQPASPELSESEIRNVIPDRPRPVTRRRQAQPPPPDVAASIDTRTSASRDTSRWRRWRDTRLGYRSGPRSNTTMGSSTSTRGDRRPLEIERNSPSGQRSSRVPRLCRAFLSYHTTTYPMPSRPIGISSMARVPIERSRTSVMYWVTPPGKRRSTTRCWIFGEAWKN